MISPNIRKNPYSHLVINKAFISELIKKLRNLLLSSVRQGNLGKDECHYLPFGRIRHLRIWDSLR